MLENWLRRPSLLYRQLCGTQGMLSGLRVTMVAIWYIKVGGLDPFQLVILGTIFEVAITLCEIPTGIVADLYSRKLSVALGYLFGGISHLLIALVPNFASFAIGAVIWGIGETFLSGAREAWVADELKHGDEEAVSIDEVFVQGKQWELWGRFIGTWLAFPLVLVAMNLPIIVGSAGMMLHGFLVYFLFPEKGFHKADTKTNSFEHMRETFRTGISVIRGKGGLIVAIMVVFMIGLSSEPFDRLWQDVLEQHFELPAVLGSQEFWWTFLNSTAMLLTVGLLTYLRRNPAFGNIKTSVKTLGIFNVLVLIGMIVFGITHNLWIAMAAFLLVRTVRRAFDPLITSWLNANASPKVRATVLSLAGQTESAGEILAGPSLGGIAGRFGNRMAVLSAAGILGIGIVPLAMRLKKVPDQTVDSVEVTE